MRRLSAFLGAAFALAIAGCADSVSVIENEHSGTFASEEYKHDASRGDIPVVVSGSVFGLDRRSLADVVVRDMQGADWSPHAHFTALPATDTARIYSYAMMFNGPREITAAALCAQPQATSSISTPSGNVGAGSVTLIAALCRYNVSTMGVTARVSNVSGPDDPKFRSLVRTAVLELTRPNQQRLLHDNENGSSDSGGGGGGGHP
jgi:hypothetical protein